MTPDQITNVRDQATTLYEYGEGCRRAGFREGWAAAMASMKRERQELGERVASEELTEARASNV